jgi:hypothetical protein
MKEAIEFKTYVNKRSDKRCLDCCKSIKKDYYIMHKEKLLEYQKDYNLKNKENISDYHRNYYRDKRDKILTQNQKGNDLPII